MNTDIEQQPFPGRPTPLAPPVKKSTQEADNAKQAERELSAKEKDAQTERDKAAGDAKLRRHKEAVAYRAGKFKLNRSHVIDGVDIVMLAFPAGSVNAGERFAVVDDKGQETDALVMQTVGSRVGFSHLKNLTGQDLWKLYGMSPMVDLFNKIKDLASNALNLRIDTIRHSDGGSTTEVVGSSDLAAETYPASGPMTADPNLQRSTGAVAAGWNVDGRDNYDGEELSESGDTNAGTPPRLGEVSRKYTGAGSQIESGRYPDISAAPIAVNDIRNVSTKYVKDGSPDRVVTSETERAIAITDGYVPAVPESPEPFSEPKSIDNTGHGLRMETVKYADGTSATGVAPLPRVSPSGSPAV
jgi:hypothetical protein